MSWLMGYVCGGLVVALVAVFTVQQLRVAAAQTEAATARSERDALSADIAEQRAAHAVAVREMEQRQRASLRAIATIYNQELLDAQAAHDQVVADLRAGFARLRTHWAGCRTDAADLPAAAGATVGADEAADLRAASAGRIVGAGAECDAQIRGLQSVVRTYQELQGVPQ